MNNNKIEIVSRTVKITGRVFKRNEGTGNICVTDEEIAQIQDNDNVIVVGTTYKDVELGRREYTGEAFRSRIFTKTKNRYGRPLKFKMIPYT
jgi:hypothetical protein